MPNSTPHPPDQDPFRDDPLAPGDPVWDALGRAPAPEPDPWLATQTMARLRREAEAPAPWWRWLRRPALAGGALAAFAALVTAWAVLSPASTEAPTVPVAFDQTDFELLVSEEPAFFGTAPEEPEPAVHLTGGSDTELVVASGEEAPLHLALEFLAEGQSEDVLFTEVSWH
ncbi:MAG: hypothetical protein AAGK14_10425 [Verrucomicrobiota bacterium]